MKIIDVRNKNKKEVRELLLPAVRTIKNGNLVVFPTETVYGLGADCFNPSAVNKIFLVKNRPYNNPLIVHISKISEIEKVAIDIPQFVHRIIKTFWPGPLSMVLKKHPKIPYIVTSGLDTVCVRLPEDYIARTFISLCNTPIAAPSANIFTRVSATDIEHIKKDFSYCKEIEYVIYSGRTKYGIESTIIDCTVYPVKVLRYGALEVEKIKRLLKENIEEPKRFFYNLKLKKSPGLFKKHYSPIKPSFLVKNLIKFCSSLSKNVLQKITFVCSDTTKNKLIKKFGTKLPIIHYGDKPKEIAKNLYLCLTLAEDMNTEKIFIEPPKKLTGLGKTIMDRIVKATGNKWLK